VYFEYDVMIIIIKSCFKCGCLFIEAVSHTTNGNLAVFITCY